MWQDLLLFVFSSGSDLLPPLNLRYDSVPRKRGIELHAHYKGLAFGIFRSSVGPRTQQDFDHIEEYFVFHRRIVKRGALAHQSRP